MILVSKLVFGSIALATFAGSVALPDPGEAARRMAASMRWEGAAEVPQPEVATLDVVQVPPAPPPCPGKCEVWELLSQIR